MSQSASNSFLVLLSRPPHQRRESDSPHQYCDDDGDLGVEKVAVSQPASKCSSGKPEEKKSPEHYQVKGDDLCDHDHDHREYCDRYYDESDYDD